MGRKDIAVFGIWAAVLAALAAPVLLRPAMVFFNHGDLYAYHVPLRHLSASSLQAGRLPFWNPYILGGVPHLANPQAALFYPASLASFLWPAAKALAFEQAAHLLWAGLGAFLLARAQGLGRGGALTLCAAYALSPMLVYRVTAGIPTLLAALSWAPWCWLLWLGGSPRGLPAALALQLLSGHAQFALINGAGMLLWAGLRRERVVLLRALAAAGAAALALSALQLVPAARFLALSNRASWGAALAGAYSEPPRLLASWLWAWSVGTPLDGGWARPISEFYEFCGAYAGAGALALAAFGAARGGRSRGPALALAAAGLFLALGEHNPLAAPLLGAFPYLRTPARWSLLFLWGVLLLAGRGARLLRGRAAAPAAAVLALLATAELAAWDRPFLASQDARPYLSANADFIAALEGPPARLLTDPAHANPNKAVLYRARNVNGYEAFYPGGLPAFAAAVEGKPAADTSRVLMSRWNSPLLAREGVAMRLAPSGSVEANLSAWPLAAFMSAAGERLRPDPRLSIERPERWRVEGRAPAGAAALRLAEPPYPGWRARWDSSPAALRPEGPLAQAASPPPGDGPRAPRLVLEFRPEGWPWLPLLSAAAWALWAGAGLAAAAREAA